jgi:ABC-type transporter Mla subunit MlaD
MTEDVFRIVVGVAVVLAALAFVIQAGVVIVFYRGSKNTQLLLTKFMGDVKPVVIKAGTLFTAANQIMDDLKPVLAKAGTAFTAANQIMDDARPQVKEFTADTVALAKSGREQVQRLGNLLDDASERARSRLKQIDHTVESTVEQVEHVSDTFRRAVMKPVKEINGLAAGISAAVSTLMYGFENRKHSKACQMPRFWAPDGCSRSRAR